MSEDQKAKPAVPSLDPRAAEVLRFLDRAKGTIAKRQPDLTIEAIAESLDSTARVLDRVVAVAGERLADLQRGQDGAVRELRVSVDRLGRQADVLTAWRSWWTKQTAAWAVVLALAFAGRARTGLASPRAGAEHPRRPAADPREPDQGSGREERKAPIVVDSRHGIGKGNLRECSVASRPLPHPDRLIWP
jgi:hypothetical protein